MFNADDMLTCLRCGQYQGAEAPVRSIAPGWVQTGGFAGPVQRCECCGGRAMHDPQLGCPRCHTYTEVELKRKWLRDNPDAQWPDTLKTRAYIAAIQRWQAEADPRAYSLLASLYGPDRAAEMMALEPPL